MFKKLLEMKSVVFAWMVSYLVILIIPIIISIVVFFNIEHIIEEEVLTSNTYMLEQIRREADNILDEVRKTYTDLTFDYNINRVLNFQGSLTDEQYYQIYMAQEVVKRLKLANIYLGDTAVYLQKSDMVISYNSISDSRTYYNIYFKDSGLTYGQWLDQVTAYYDNPAYVSVRKLNDKQQVREQIMCLKSVGYEQTSEMLTAICMIDQELLSDYFSNVRSQYNSFTNIIDAQNHFLLSDAQNQRFLGLASEMLSEGGSVSYQTIDGERYVISYIHSGTSDWKYVCAVPQREFSKKTNHVRLLTILGVVLSLLIGSVILYLVVQKNYTPIKAMARSLADRQGAGGNEYRLISSALDENKKIHTRLKKQSDILKTSFFRGLLLSNKISDVPMSETLRYLNLETEGKNFYTLLLYARDFSVLFGEEESMEEAQKQELSALIIKNVVGEMLGEKYCCELVEMEEGIAGILMLDRMQPNPKQAVRGILRHAKTFLRENVNLELCGVLGSLRDNLIGISDAYQECIYAKEYSLIRDMDDFVAADEIEKNEAQDYYYPIDKEYQIINYIKTGDGAHAKATLEEIYEANLNQATDSMKCRLLFYNILSTLMKTPGSQQDYSAMEAQLLRQIDSGDLREAQRQIEQFVDALCVQFGQELENRDGKIVSDVVKFMKENFSDVDLNVSAIADTFHMAPPYLSKKFRQETGESVLDYLHKLRIAKAKEYMKTTYLPLEEILRRVGYGNARTFTRVFKKMEGVAPGEYRKTL